MATITGKRLICQTPLSEFDVEMLHGSPFYRRYDDYIKLFSKYIPNIDFESTFAYPVENRDNGSLDWYIYCPNEPQKITDNTALLNKRNELFAQIQKVSDNASKNISLYLERILSIEGNLLDEASYVCDGRVIIGFWGVTLRKGSNYIASISDKITDHRTHNVQFFVDGNAILLGETIIIRSHGYKLHITDIPVISVNEGSEFVEWQPFDPENVNVEMDLMFTAKIKDLPPVIVPEPEPYTPPITEPIRPKHKVWFIAGDNATIQGESGIEVYDGETIKPNDVPMVVPNENYLFKGWENSLKAPIKANTSIHAIIEKRPWTELFWHWFMPIGMLVCLFWILLATLIAQILYIAL